MISGKTSVYDLEIIKILIPLVIFTAVHPNFASAWPLRVWISKPLI